MYAITCLCNYDKGRKTKEPHSFLQVFEKGFLKQRISNGQQKPDKLLNLIGNKKQDSFQ